MRQIPLRKFAEFTTAEIVRAVMENNPQGMNAAEIRKRVRVLDGVEAAEKACLPALLLEDADHATLSAAINTFQFAKASRDLLSVVDDVTNAKEPPKEVKPGKAA